jgi:hypothetical protein
MEWRRSGECELAHLLRTAGALRARCAASRVLEANHVTELKGQSESEVDVNDSDPTAAVGRPDDFQRSLH